MVAMEERQPLEPVICWWLSLDILCVFDSWTKTRVNRDAPQSLMLVDLGLFIQRMLLSMKPLSLL